MYIEAHKYVCRAGAHSSIKLGQSTAVGSAHPTFLRAYGRRAVSTHHYAPPGRPRRRPQRAAPDIYPRRTAAPPRGAAARPSASAATHAQRRNTGTATRAGGGRRGRTVSPEACTCRATPGAPSRSCRRCACRAYPQTRSRAHAHTHAHISFAITRYK
jgi:hypothetical protein